MCWSVVAVALLAALVIAAIARLRPDFDDLDVPLQLLTFVAACAVVGTRLSGRPLGRLGRRCSAGSASADGAVGRCGDIGGPGCATARVAAGNWPASRRPGWRYVAADSGSSALAVGLLALAICLYCLMTGLVLWRACHEPSAPDLFQPDMWILMGGAAIATLAGDHIHEAGVEADSAGDGRDVDRRQPWIPLLAVASVRRARRQLVGGGVPAGDVLVGDVRDGRRNGLAAR